MTTTNYIQSTGGRFQISPRMLLLGILLLAAILRLPFLESIPAYQVDEGSWNIGARDKVLEGDWCHHIRKFCVSPIHSILFYLWFLIWSPGLFTARLLSVFLDLGCIVLMFLIGRRLFNDRAGLIAAFLYTANSVILLNARRAMLETDMFRELNGMFALPVCYLLVSYLYLAIWHRKWWLFGTVMHEDRWHTLWGALTYWAHFLACLPTALFVSACIAGGTLIASNSISTVPISGIKMGLILARLGLVLVAAFSLGSILKIGTQQTLHYALQKFDYAALLNIRNQMKKITVAD